MRRGIIVTLVLLLMFPVTVWLTSPWLAAPLGNLLLANTGLQLVELQMGRPGLEGVRVERLELRKQGNRFLVLNSLTVLWRDGFGSFEINASRGLLVVDGQSATPDSAEAGSDYISDLFPSRLLPDLPVINLSLLSLVVEGSQPVAQHLSAVDHVQLSISPAAALLQGDLVWNQAANAAYFHAELSATVDDLIKVELFQDKQALLSTALQLQQSAAMLNGQLHVSLQLPSDGLQVPLGAENSPLQGGVEAQVTLTASDTSLDALLAAPQLQMNGRFEGDLRQQASALRLNTDFDATFGDRQWFLSFARVSAAQAPLLSLQTEIDKRSHQLSANAVAPIVLQGRLAPLADDPHVSIDPANSVSLSYRIDGDSVAEARLSNFQGQVNPTEKSFQLMLDAEIASNISKLYQQLGLALTLGDKPLLLREAQLTVPAHVQFSEAGISIDLAAPARLSAQAVSAGMLQLQQPELLLPPQTLGLTFAENNSDALITTGPLQFSLKSAAATLDAYQLQPLHIDGQIAQQGADWHWQLSNQRLFLRQTEARGEPFVLPPYYLNGVFNLKPEQPSNITFELQNQCRQPLLSGHLLQERQLMLDLEHSFNPEHSLAHWLNLPQLTSDLVQGTLRANLHWDIQKNANPTLQAQLKEGAIRGSLGALDAIQLSLSGDGTDYKQYQLQGEIGKMNVGVQLSDIVFNAGAKLTGDHLSVDIPRVQATLFGGRLWLQDERWEQGSDAEFNVHIEKLDLGEIIKTQNVGGLAATGSISGIQPLRISAAGDIALVEGSMKAENGVIRYQNVLKDSADLNPQLKQTMNVLENFEYQQLQTTTEYTDNKLVLSSKISGRNPDISAEQEYQLNLNTEIPLQSSIQLMRLQAGLEAQVEKLFGAGATSHAKQYCQF